MKFSDTELESILKNPIESRNGSQFISDCPYCGKEGHFIISRKTDKTNIRGENVSFYWSCKKCNEGGGLYRLLKKLGKLWMGDFKDSIVDVNKVEIMNLEAANKLDYDYTVPTIPAPIGYERIYQNKYLENRGFTKTQFEKYEVGASWMNTYSDFVIFLIQEDGETKAHVSRRMKDGAWFKEQEDKVKDWNKKFPENKRRKPLRYNNSVDTDFGKLIYGLDEINERVDTMVIVEGITDKFNVERILDMDAKDSHWKCGATFGKKINEVQIHKLKAKGIKNVILLYDPDALEDSKRYSYDLTREFRVQVGYLDTKDPGDLSEDELYTVMENLYDPLNFNLSKVSIKKL